MNSRRLLLWSFWAVCACVAPSQSSAQTVQLINNVRPLSTDFYVGETFTLNVWGGASQTVNISATHNGVPLGSSTLGTTNGSGFFTVNGVMTTAEIGTWVETLTVGGSTASPILEFEVEGSAVEPCESVDVDPNPLIIFSQDYYTLGEYQGSIYGSGSQSGEGEAPYCAIAGHGWSVPGTGNEHLQVTSVNYPSLYEVEADWEDVGGRVFGSYPAFVFGGSVFIGVDVRNGIPFVGLGATNLTVFRIDY